MAACHTGWGVVLGSESLWSGSSLGSALACIILCQALSASLHGPDVFNALPGWGPLDPAELVREGVAKTGRRAGRARLVGRPCCMVVGQSQAGGRLRATN
eukprot:scaffold372950_cov27-Prasinocladus_malaysianus.AAC.1